MNTYQPSKPASVASESFIRDPRRRQELKMRPHIDQIYREVFGYVVTERHDGDGKDLLDIEHAVDVLLRFPNGQILNGQEKSLSARYCYYLGAPSPTLTVEYEQDPLQHEPGDWFKLGAQFYFCGYADEALDGFLCYVIVNWPSLVLATHSGNIIWRTNQNNNGHARASFRYVKFDQIPGDCIIAMERP